MCPTVLQENIHVIAFFLYHSPTLICARLYVNWHNLSHTNGIMSNQGVRKIDTMSTCQVMHYSDVIMSVVVSLIAGDSIVYSTICSGADQRKHQSSTSLAFVREIHRLPMNSPHKGPVTLQMFLFDDVIMERSTIGHMEKVIFPHVVWNQYLVKKQVRMSNFKVSTKPADGLAPLGARPSAVMVMTKYWHQYVHKTGSWVHL